MRGVAAQKDYHLSVELYPVCLYLPCTGECRTGCNKPGVVSPVLSRGIITPLDLLAILYLMQPNIPLVLSATRAHCWLMFTLLSTRTLRPLSAEIFSSRVPSAWISAWDYSFPGARLCTSPCWISWGSCQTTSSPCRHPFGWKYDLLVYQSFLPAWCHLQTCRG